MAQPKIAVVNEIKIEKGVPVSRTASGGHGLNAKYPLKDMEIGDSFFVSGVGRSTVSSACTYFRIKHNSHRFITRAVTEGGVKGIRVWRVA